MKRIVLIFTAFALMMNMSLTSSAQSKPKRNAANDNVGVAKRAASKKSSRRAASKQSFRRSATSKSTAEESGSTTSDTYTYSQPQQQAERVVPYLNLDKYECTFIESGSTRTFFVYTNVNYWSVDGLPSWCYVANKTNNYFEIRTLANPDHQPRTATITVKADDVVKTVKLTQNAQPAIITAYIADVTLEHNIYRHNKGRCLIINGTMSIKGAKGIDCYAVATIEYDNQNAMHSTRNVKAKSGYSKYTFSDTGSVYTATSVTPITDTSQNYRFSLELPNNAMYLTEKKNKLMIRVQVFDSSSGKYIYTHPVPIKFKAKNKYGVITTK